MTDVLREFLKAGLYALACVIVWGVTMTVFIAVIEGIRVAALRWRKKP